MRACKKTNALKLLLIAAVILFSTQTMADFLINDLQPELKQGKLTISGTLDLTLTEKVEEAVAKGIPVDVDINFRLKRERKWLWAEELKSWTIRRQIRYHALSRQYFVSDATSSVNKLENFTSLRQALRHMGALNELSFDVTAVTQVAQPDDIYQLEVRVSLDIESLPAPLRPVAYTSLDWHLNSGWTSWTVKR